MKEKILILVSFMLFSVCCFVSLRCAEQNIIAVIGEESYSFSNEMIILDAGHGGEDGGAVAFDGTLEKDINLEISETISLYFELFGINYIKIRDSDESIGDNSLDTIRKRKVSDIHRRYEIINSYENSVLLSIHQNMFSVEKYSGAQVFYGGQDEQAMVLAEIIQRKITDAIQPENTRKIKKADNSIYLLDKAIRPSVMVECGFMSNPDELSKLKSTEYQSQISYFITMSVIEFLII